MLHLLIVPAEESASHLDLTVSQADIDSLIRSKAAMYTILETITASVARSERFSFSCRSWIRAWSSARARSASASDSGLPASWPSRFFSHFPSWTRDSHSSSRSWSTRS